MADDEVPETRAPLLGVFFEEMSPVPDSSIERATLFVESDAHTLGDELPGKNFIASPASSPCRLATGHCPIPSRSAA